MRHIAGVQRAILRADLLLARVVQARELRKPWGRRSYEWLLGALPGGSIDGRVVVRTANREFESLVFGSSRAWHS